LQSDAGLEKEDPSTPAICIRFLGSSSSPTKGSLIMGKKPTYLAFKVSISDYI